MKFSTAMINSYARIVSTLNTEYIYLDVANGLFYSAGDRQAMKLAMDFTDVKDDEKKVYVIGKDDFLHISCFTDELEMDSSYRYVSSDGQTKGKFAHNEDQSDTLSSISEMFDQKDDYVKMFRLTDEISDIYDALNRGMLFVDGNSNNPCFRNLNIRNGNVCSSSDFRIYIRKVKSDAEGLIHADVLKFILQLGYDTEVYNNRDSYLIEKEGISLYFSTVCGTEYIPIDNENFKAKYLDVFKSTKIVFSPQELSSKLQFLSFYAKNNPSTLAYMKVKDNTVTLYANTENSVNVNAKCIEYNEGTEGEFILPFNSSSMITILQKLSSGKDVSLFFSKEEFRKLFILQFSDDEFVILAKVSV